MSPVDYWEEIRNRYLEYLAEETGVSNGWEYYEEYGASDHNASDFRDDLEAVTDLSMFERVYPANSQYVALVMINPKLTEQAGIDRELTDVDQSEYSSRIKQSMRGVKRWFGSDGSTPTEHPQKDIVSEILPEIADRTSLISSNQLHPSKNGFFDQIYYTNWYKLATKNGKSIPNTFTNSVTGSIPTETLHTELAEIDPTLVIPVGSYPWRAFREHSEPVQDSDQIPHNHKVTEVEGHLYHYEKDGTSFHVLPSQFRTPNPSNRNFPTNLELV